METKGNSSCAAVRVWSIPERIENSQLIVNAGEKYYTVLGARLRQFNDDGIVEETVIEGLGGYDFSSSVSGLMLSKRHGWIVADEGKKGILIHGKPVAGVTSPPSGSNFGFGGGGTAGYRDGEALKAKFMRPNGLAEDKEGNIYILDDNCIRVLSPDLSVVRTLAGLDQTGYADGRGTKARFSQLTSVLLSPDGQSLFVADRHNGAIRKVDIKTGDVTTIAKQDGLLPTHLAMDAAGTIFFTTMAKIMRLDVSTGQLERLAGGAECGFEDGSADEARFHFPCGIIVDSKGRILVSDNNRIRVIEGAAVGSSTTSSSSSSSSNSASVPSQGAVAGDAYTSSLPFVASSLLTSEAKATSSVAETQKDEKEEKEAKEKEDKKEEQDQLRNEIELLKQQLQIEKEKRETAEKALQEAKKSDEADDRGRKRSAAEMNETSETKEGEEKGHGLYGHI